MTAGSVARWMSVCGLKKALAEAATLLVLKKTIEKMRGQCLKIQQGFVNIENKQWNRHDDSSVAILTWLRT